MKRIILVLVLFVSFLYSSQYGVVFNEQLKESFNKRFGDKSLIRINLYEKTIKESENLTLLKKLLLVNDFFNQMSYLDDIKLWKKDDYWSSPLQLLGLKAGDSEDFALSKYYTLVAMGVEPEKLKLIKYDLESKKTPSKLITNEYIVLGYFHSLESLPLILDRINKKLRIEKDIDSFNIMENIKNKGIWEEYFQNCHFVKDQNKSNCQEIFKKILWRF